MKSLLIHVRPLRFSTMQRVDIRLGSAADGAALGLGGFVWESCVVRRPRLSIDLITEEMDGALQPGRGDLEINLETITQVTDAQQLHWSGAPITIYDADDLDYATMPVEFTGIVKEPKPNLETGHLALSIEVSKSKLQRPLLGSSFTGGGGLNGDAGKRGVLKPAGFGFVRDVEPVMFDETDNIGMVDGYGNLAAVVELFEGASSLGAPVADYPTYAALKAAIVAGTVPKGRWATSIADGCIGLGAPPAGTITCDCQFGISRPGAWIRRLLEYHASIPTAEIDIGSLSTLDAVVDRPIHYWTGAQRDVLDLIQKIAGSCNANTLLTFQGKVAVVRPFGGEIVGTLDRNASSTPPVTAWQTAEPEAPAWRMTARADRPGRVLTLDEVFYEDDIEDRGGFVLTDTYRQGHAVWMPNGSQWLYINATPSAGHQPPDPPAVSDAWWQQIKPPTTAADLFYADGTPIEDLKPSVAGATRNIWRGAWQPDTDYAVGDGFSYLGSSWITRVEHRSSALDPPPNVNVEVQASKGDNATPLLVQWSVDGVTNWHTNFTPGDLYLRTSADNGATWSAPAKVVGEGGSGGADGNHDQFVFRRSATLPTTPTGNGVPTNWFDAPPAANGQPLWMSVAEQTPAGLLVGFWSTPVQIEGAEGASAFRLADVANTTVTAPTTLKKTGGTNSWNGKGRTVEGFLNGASVSADQVLNTFVGLTTDPDNVSNAPDYYTTIDYALHPSPNGQLYRYRNGTGLALGANAPGRLQVWSDDRFVYYARGGVVLSTHPVNAQGEMLFGSFAIFAVGDALTGIAFGSAGPAGDDGNSVVAQGSVDGVNWHLGLSTGDIYMRLSNDGGLTFGAAVLIKGENGSGGPGATGNIKQHVFRRSPTQPSAPSGNGIPSSWFDAPPAGSDPLWMSVAEQTSTGLLVTGWSTPVRITGDPGANGLSVVAQGSVNGSTWHTGLLPGDIYMRISNDGGVNFGPAVQVKGEGGGTGNFKQHVFRRSASQPSTPSGNGIPSLWSDGPPAADGNPLWMSVSEQNAAGVIVVNWSAPVRITGDPGVNGRTMDPAKASVDIAADYLGNVKAGQLPRTVQCTFLDGSTNVSSLTGWAKADSGCTTSIDANGLVTCTAVASTGAFTDVTGVYSGTTITKRINWPLNKDPAPPSSSTSGGSPTPAGVNSTVQPANPTRIVTLSSVSGQLRAAGSADYAPPQPADGTVNLTAKMAFGYRPVGGSGWTMGSTFTGSLSYARGFPEPEQSPGTVGADSTFTGLTPGGLYEVGCFIWKASGAGTFAYTDGYFTVGQS